MLIQKKKCAILRGSHGRRSSADWTRVNRMLLAKPARIKNGVGAAQQPVQEPATNQAEAPTQQADQSPQQDQVPPAVEEEALAGFEDWLPEPHGPHTQEGLIAVIDLEWPECTEANEAILHVNIPLACWQPYTHTDCGVWWRCDNIGQYTLHARHAERTHPFEIVQSELVRQWDHLIDTWAYIVSMTLYAFLHLPHGFPVRTPTRRPSTPPLTGASYG